MYSVQGHALVASPYLSDPNFLRSVTYILQHDEEGAFGLILNRPTQSTVGQLLEQLNEQSFSNESHVYWGGPVDGPLMLLQECLSGGASVIFAASDQAKILEICSGNQLPLGESALGEADQANWDASQKDLSPGRYRLFDGYAGWGPGQLEAELKSGGWLEWEIKPDHIFSDPDELWELAVKAIGRDILAGGIDPQRIPDDPASN